MATELLAELEVQLTARGADGVSAALAGIKAQLKAADNSAAAVARGLDAAFQSARNAALSAAAPIKAVGEAQERLAYLVGMTNKAYDAGLISARQANKAVAKASAEATAAVEAAGAAAGRAARGQLALAGAFAVSAYSIQGWVRAGLAGTTQGELLGLRFQFLHREIANLFLPAIERVSGAVQRAVDYFRSLNREQQESIGKFLGFGTAALGVMAVLPRLTASLAALKTLGAGGAWGFGIAGVVALVASTKEGERALKELGSALAGALRPVLPVLAEVARAVSDGLTPFLRAAADVLGTLPGKWLFFGTGVLLLTARMVPALATLSTSFVVLGVSIKAALGWILPAVIAITAAIQFLPGVIGAVAESVRHRGGETGNFLVGGTELERGRLRPGVIDAVLAGKGNDRHDLTLKGGQFEDVRATQHRFQSALLRTESGTQDPRRVSAEELWKFRVLLAKSFGNTGQTLGRWLGLGA